MLIKRSGHKKRLAILKREFTFSVVYGVLDVLKCVGQLKNFTTIYLHHLTWGLASGKPSEGPTIMPWEKLC